MPNIKSAKKRVSVIKTKTLRNQIIKTNLKTCIKKFEECVANGDAESAVAACKVAFKKIDQAVAKGVLHKNTASRRKSQLSSKLNKLSA